MEIKALPAPHRYAICAWEDMSIKEFYRGVFDEVFIFFHPFIKPVTIEYELFEPDTYPSKSQIIQHCEGVTWEEFIGLSGIPSIRQLDIGLRTSILGLGEKFADESAAKNIWDVCEGNQLIPPCEGCFPELLINKILHSVQRIGHEWIWGGDEFCTERKLELIDDLIDEDEIRYRNLFTHDQQLLLTTHWDSHFSLLCSDKKTIDHIVDECRLEGFYCNEETQIYWSVWN